MPILQTSIAGEDSVWPTNNSGAIYFNDPACTFSGFKPEDEPKIPKSTTLRSMSKSLFLFFEMVLEISCYKSYGLGFLESKIF